MMAPAHMVSGAAAWLGLGALATHVGRPLPTVALAGGAVLATVAALGPDIDTDASTMSRSLGWFTRIVSLVTRVLAGGHRNGTHSLSGVAVCAVSTWAIACHWLGGPWWIPASVAAGYLAAVLGDCLTPMGCPLFWPLSQRDFSAGLFSTDSFTERWIVTPCLVIAAAGCGFAAVGAESPDLLTTLTGM